jgi:hypothetical protein
MSYSASTIGLPQLRDSISARWAAFSRILSDSRNRIRPRSCGVLEAQGPVSKAALAAATARFTSSTFPAGTCAITSSVEGSRTAVVLFDALSTHSPLMYI